MNNIGISTASLFMKTEVENSFDIIKKLDCKVVEVFLTTFSEYKKDFVEAMLPSMKGLDIHSVHSLNTHYEPELFNSQLRTYNDAVDILRQVLYAAKVFGAHYYTFHGRSNPKKIAINFEQIGTRLIDVCNICKEYDVELCYENVHWALYNYSGFFKDLKSICPSVMATLDIKQAMQSGVDVYDYMDDMGDSIRTIHLCDMTDNGKTCLPGKGRFDFYRFFERLALNECNAPCLLEVYSNDYNTYDELARSLDYLRTISAKVQK